MRPENDEEVEVAKLLPLEVLAHRMSFDPTLSGIVRHLGELHEKSGQALPKPFDGIDHSQEIPVFLAEALLRNQVLVLEVRTSNLTREKPSFQRRLAESKIRELEMLLIQATKVAIDIHMNMHEVG